MDTSRDEHPAIAAPADAGLRCPKCDYNLTGLAEDRCPECGEVFNRELLIERARNGFPIPGWDDVSNPVVAFVGLCLKTWFLPIAVGRRFPVLHEQRSIRKFEAVALTVAACIYLLIYLACFTERMDPEPWTSAGLIVGAWCGVAACEMWARSALVSCFGPCSGAERKMDAWTGIVGLYRSFLPLTAALLPISFILVEEDFFRWLDACILISTILVLWWSVSLALAATTGSPARWRVFPLLLLLWIGAAGSAVLGAFITFLCAGFFSPLSRH